jgi:hypothetical protein
VHNAHCSFMVCFTHGAFMNDTIRCITSPRQHGSHWGSMQTFYACFLSGGCHWLATRGQCNRDRWRTVPPTWLSRFGRWKHPVVAWVTRLRRWVGLEHLPVTGHLLPMPMPSVMVFRRSKWCDLLHVLESAVIHFNTIIKGRQQMLKLL